MKLVAALAAIALAAAGCGGAGAKQTQTAGVQGSVPHPVRIVQSRAADVRLRGHGAGFLSPTRLAFLISGSSSCMPTPTTLAVDGPDSIRIQLADGWPKSQVCLTDLTFETVVIAISPKQIDVHRRLTVRLFYPLGKRPAVLTASALS